MQNKLIFAGLVFFFAFQSLDVTPSSKSYCVRKLCPFLFFFIFTYYSMLCHTCVLILFCSPYKKKKISMCLKVQHFPLNVSIYRSVVSMQYSKTSTSCSCEQRLGRVQCSAHIKLFLLVGFLSSRLKLHSQAKPDKEETIFTTENVFRAWLILFI